MTTTPNGTATVTWTDVEQKLWSARKRLQQSESGEDCQSVGILCRETMICLGQYLLDNYFRGPLPDVSTADGYKIISALIDKELPGKSNGEMRAYVRASFDLANSIQHSLTSNYAQASICVEAMFHLMQLVLFLASPSEAHPGKKLLAMDLGNAETIFMISCITSAFDSHPVTKERGFVFQGISWGRSLLTIHARSESGVLTASLRRASWWKNANKSSAERILDELLVRLIAERENQLQRGPESTPRGQENG